MNEFSIASDTDFAVLESRCRNRCVVFASRRLPPGCSQHRSRVGFDPVDSGTLRIMVDYGITYQGNNSKLAALFRDGMLRFPDFAALKSFLRDDVREAFGYSASQSPTLPVATTLPFPAPASPKSLTDFEAISEALDRPKTAQAMIQASTLAATLMQRIVGQEEAIATLAGMAARHVSRSHPRRPASVFMVGSTGVGKTKAAMALAECLGEQGAHHAFLRLDMCEYQEKHRASQLLGAPQGYVGYGEGGQLVNHLANHPNSLILLDEIDKAHPDVFKTLMNAIDSGRLSSPSAIAGQHEIDCRRTIFVLTSNLAPEKLLSVADQMGNSQQIDALCRKHLTRHGIPSELAGRIGAFCLFRPLSEAQRARILVQAVAMVSREYEVEVEYIAPEVVVQLLNESGGDFGARPDEQTVDRVFGEIFAQARNNGVRKLRLETYPT